MEATLNTNEVREWKRFTDHRTLPLEWELTIPTHWGTHRLKEVADARPSNVDKKKHEGEQPVMLCNYVDVYKNERITFDMDFMKATASDTQVEQFSIQAGDVIITKDSEAWNDIGVPAFVPEAIDDLVCGYHLTLIRPDSRKLMGSFLARCLEAEGLRDQFCVAANGVTRFGLGTQDIRCFVLPVPPLPEQRSIAAFLDRETARIDALIGHKQRLIGLLEEKRQAVISHAVTQGLDPTVEMKDSGVEWVGATPAHWKVKRLKNTSELLRGKFTHRPRNDPDFYNGDHPFIQTGDVARADKYIRTYSQTLNENGYSVSKEFAAGTVVVTSVCP